MYRRLNITLPEDTVRLIDRVVKKGNRSRFISKAVRRYVREMGRASLRRGIKQGAIRRAERDRAMAEEWFFLEEEAWAKERE